MPLKTDYTNDILNTDINVERKYVIKDNNGSVVVDNATIEDVTAYTREGSRFGANDINATNTAVNELNDSLAEHEKNSLGTSVALTTSNYTTLTDGYMCITNDTTASKYTEGYVNNQRLIRLSNTSTALTVSETVSIFVRKGSQIKIGGNGNGNGKFYPLV